MNTTFKKDVIEGLSKSLKRLPSKYFYDKKGDQLFQQIMDMEEYYLPDCEREIISNHSKKLFDAVTVEASALNIIELGAGDGRKTVEMLKQFEQKEVPLTYYPLDISPHILEVNKNIISSSCPEVDITPIAGDYFETMQQLPQNTGRKLVLFLGSNIGNYAPDQAVSFLRKVRSNLQPGDFIAVAFDLKKNPHKILAAYNDASGITKAFNLNLLRRINRELGADFTLSSFDHYASYAPITGKTASYIVSLEQQEIKIDQNTFTFEKDEVIHVEVSQKYDRNMIEMLASKSDLQVANHYMDSKNNYSLSLLKL